MCSTPNERLTRLRAAIDALAAQAGLPDSPADPVMGQAGAGQAEDVDARLARLWQMLAQLDPELARRLPRYLG